VVNWEQFYEASAKTKDDVKRSTYNFPLYAWRYWSLWYKWADRKVVRPYLSRRRLSMLPYLRKTRYRCEGAYSWLAKTHEKSQKLVCWPVCTMRCPWTHNMLNHNPVRHWRYHPSTHKALGSLYMYPVMQYLQWTLERYGESQNATSRWLVWSGNALFW